MERGGGVGSVGGMGVRAIDPPNHGADHRTSGLQTRVI